MPHLNLIRDNVEQVQDELQSSFELLQQAYNAQPNSSFEHRAGLLKLLKSALLENQNALITALNSDFESRSDFDTVMADIMPTVSHINYTVKHLNKWMKASPRKAGLLLSPSKLEVQYQPVGVVGIISPWNFPIMLSLAPLATALAAGNRIMVKLSEYTPRTNEVIKDLLRPLDSHVQVVTGNAQIAAKFTSLKFAHLLFTGSTHTGRLVAQSAAKNLVPVTLELGGKSPVVITPSSDLNKVMDSIIFGKCVNAGQICVAPDYVLIEQDKADAFAELFIERFITLYGNNPQDFTHIINDTQHRRLQQYLSEAELCESCRVVPVTGDALSDNSRRMLPHLVLNPDTELRLMREEIFGPILPVVGYQNLEQAVAIINKGERPLALYIMSEDDISTNYILNRTHSGGVAINDTILQVAAEDAPFGGIGESGMGRYHGKEGFLSFSHARTVLRTPTWLPRARYMLKAKSLTLRVLRKLFIK
ncbi:aldehyde dehydrogenase family protein [Vibrio gallicus]|uniref:aldehyde dehydrogenase family protein n=1 Tax=Vibrio gallicus TaxID=190897 RepID=UPI0021C3CCEA|nr:aldehyde dehydrogenase family protein [Vibrio gallicus]